MISTEYDQDLGAVIVKMPGYIRQDVLEAWVTEFLDSLRQADNPVALLLDTNSHDFESIECLKILRKIFEEPIVQEKIQRTAFVSPLKYRKAEVISQKEAYFESFPEAYKWLQLEKN